MYALTDDFESHCRVLLGRYFKAHPNPGMRKEALKVLRRLKASGRPLKGKREAWAAGILYAVANDGWYRCGVGILNSDFEKLMGVTMGTVYERAERVREFVEG